MNNWELSGEGDDRGRQQYGHGAYHIGAEFQITRPPSWGDNARQAEEHTIPAEQETPPVSSPEDAIFGIGQTVVEQATERSEGVEPAEEAVVAERHEDSERPVEGLEHREPVRSTTVALRASEFGLPDALLAPRGGRVVVRSEIVNGENIARPAGILVMTIEPARVHLTASATNEAPYDLDAPAARNSMTVPQLPNTLTIRDLPKSPVIAAESIASALYGYATQAVEDLTDSADTVRQGLRPKPDAVTLGLGDSVVPPGVLRRQMIGGDNGITRIVIAKDALSGRSPLHDGKDLQPLLDAVEERLTDIGCTLTGAQTVLISDNGMPGSRPAIELTFARRADEPEFVTSGGGDVPPGDPPPPDGGATGESDGDDDNEEFTVPEVGAVTEVRWDEGEAIRAFREVWDILQESDIDPATLIKNRPALIRMLPFLLGDDPTTSRSIAEEFGVSRDNVRITVTNGLNELISQVPDSIKGRIPKPTGVAGRQRDMTKVGPQIGLLRTRVTNPVTVQAAADQLGIATSTIYHFLKGSQLPDATTAEYIMMAFNLPPTEIDRLMSIYEIELSTQGVQRQEQRRETLRASAQAGESEVLSSPMAFSILLSTLANNVRAIGRAELTRQLGCTKGELADILTGRRAPSMDFLQAFLDITDAAPEQRQQLLEAYPKIKEQIERDQAQGNPGQTP